MLLLPRPFSLTCFGISFENSFSVGNPVYVSLFFFPFLTSHVLHYPAIKSYSRANFSVL